jgi:hypothetical protein
MASTYTWPELNRLLKEMNNEAEVLAFYKDQRRAGVSQRWRERVRSRYKVLRNRREKHEVAVGGKR